MAKDKTGIYYILDVERLWASPHQVEQRMVECAQRDGVGTTVAFHQDPGSAGVNEAQATARALDGFNVRFSTVTGDKETRAKPCSAQAEAGNIKIVRGRWNNDFLRELEHFPGGAHDDQVDGLSGAYNHLRDIGCGNVTRIGRPERSGLEDDGGMWRRTERRFNSIFKGFA